MEIDCAYSCPSESSLLQSGHFIAVAHRNKFHKYVFPIKTTYSINKF
ncbi:MAG TPA: hypothetical protein PLP76_10150 [Bacteroidales bacterium]|nr:hypothetical protein [Bacteroidales bacterium]HPJ92251.1 hypothetical protein [Bacteroidales bacterium]